ncbi:MAG: alpha/beta hydrolase [Pseudomonadota bacterium]
MKRLFITSGIVLALLVTGFLVVREPDVPLDELKTDYANGESEFVEISPGFQVHVRDQGPVGAPVLVLIHGFSASLHTWTPWADRLAESYRVVSLDLPGHGLTGPHPDACYTADCMVAVVDGIADRKGIERFVIGGNSMGGWVSWNYARSYPEKLAGMILVDASGPIVEREADGVPIGFRILNTPVVNQLAKHITPRGMIEASLVKTVVDPAFVTEDQVDRYWRLLRRPGNRQAVIDFTQTPRGTPATADLLSGIDVPTLIIWGAEDSLIPVEAGKVFAAGLPDARLVVFDGVGHIPQEEAPDRSAAEAASFLKRVYPPAPGFADGIATPAMTAP